MDKNDLIITYGTNVAKMTKQVLEKADLASRIPANAKIGIKPNLVVAKPHDSGATTSPVMIGALIEYLQGNGFKDILVLEGSWVGDNTKRAFDISGIGQVAKEHGVSVFDIKDDTYEKVQAGPIEMEISKTVLGLDFLINMPVLKGHCQTMVTGAMKNLKGCMSDREKRHFHQLGLHKPIAYLNTILHPGFILMDGLCGDLDFEEGGNPVPMNRLIAALDPVLIDSYEASAMGYSPDEIDYIRLGHELGIGSNDVEHANMVVLEHDYTPVKSTSSRKVKKLAEAVNAKDACSACYANLIQALARLDDQGKLSYFKKHPICIGQGYKGQTGDGVGSGICTKGFRRYVVGCPPTTAEILKTLRAELSEK